MQSSRGPTSSLPRYLRAVLAVAIANWIDAGILATIVSPELIDRFGIESFLMAMSTILLATAIDRIAHRKEGIIEYLKGLFLRLVKTFPLLFGECFALMYLLTGHRLPLTTTIGLVSLIGFLAIIRVSEVARSSSVDDHR